MREPDRIGDGFSPHVLRHLTWWCGAVLVFGMIFLVLVSWAPNVLHRDPNLLIRLIIEKVSLQILGVTFSFGIIGFYETITNGNLLGRVLESSVSSAVFLSVVLLCSTAIFIYV